MKTLLGYGLVILIGITGLLFVTGWTIKGESDPLQWIVSLLSMLLILIAVRCYSEERGQR